MPKVTSSGSSEISFCIFQTSKVIDSPRYGLVTLLEMRCDFCPDKRFLANWRIRSVLRSNYAYIFLLILIPSSHPNHYQMRQMLRHVRANTHFLLHIYDNMWKAVHDLAVSRPASLQVVPVPQ